MHLIGSPKQGTPDGPNLTGSIELVACACMLTLKKAVPGFWVFPNTCSSYQNVDGKKGGHPVHCLSASLVFVASESDVFTGS
ncbi:hypothetical protein TNCV_415751 [Trichonephila clavipes]|nr:hypothetical protein TNCV_415751 [Trichonephila clavipes]